MTLSNGMWYATYFVPQRADQLDYAFNNGSGTWDNNNFNDWHFNVPLPSVGAPPSLPVLASKANVMMQGFYWNVPAGGTWYGTMSAKASELRYMQGGHGIDRLWFPAPQKSGGGLSMGYDPYDYYDLGEYNQKSTTETRFGSRTELKNTLAAYKNLGVVSMADLVLNHRTGGASESNPNRGGTSYTDFSGVASGQATWNYNQFHPSTFEFSDEGVFDSYASNDICHVGEYTSGSPWFDLIEWGNWLTNSANAGFDGGWRFDFPKGINPSYIADFRKNTGDAFGILEYFDGNMSLIEDYVKYSGNTAAFDFPAYFTMINVFNNGYNIADLIDSSKVYAAKDPAKAVTFVANHDTDKDAGVTDIGDKMLAYAYILTYQGYPCIFWKDYYGSGGGDVLKNLGGQSGNGIDPLVWVRGALGGGQPDIQLLKTNDPDLLVYGTLNGTSTAPGYIFVLNTHDTLSQSAVVNTANAFLQNKTLVCQAWYSYDSNQNSKPANVTSVGGVVTVSAPPRGYAVYSVSTALPFDWFTKDVGSVGVGGSAILIEDNFIMTGSGSDIGGLEDAFYYLYQTASGDSALQARVVSLDNTDPAAKAGVMIRQGTGNNAKNAAVLVTPENGVVFQWRTSPGGFALSASAAGVTAPCWVRLERSSNVFSAYYSANGTAWTQIGTGQTVSLPSFATRGLVTTSHNNNRLTTSVIDNVDMNLGPALDPIADQTLIAGATLALTNSATDADTPVQTLTYSLINPPLGASINSSDGIFDWRPLMSQAPTTQTVSVAVADNGVPMLKTVQNFTVTVDLPVEPTISSASVTNGNFGFTINGDAGPDYTILTTTNLMTGWNPVDTFNSPTLPFSWSTNTTASPVQFYQIQLGP